MVDDSPQLKHYNVIRFHINDERGSRDMLEVECPNCRHSFWVEPHWVTGKRVKFQGRLRTYHTASCPYCFKTGKRTGPEND